MTLSRNSSPGAILIISNGALCRNPRVLKEATALGRAGHAVTVLTVRNHAASEVHDLELLRTAPFQREVVDMLGDGGQSTVQPRLGAWLARQAVARFGWQSPYALGPVNALLRQARQFPADLTIVHNEAAHYVGTQLLRDGRRVAADIEDWHSEDLLPPDRRARPLRLLRRIERTLLHACVHTTTTSHALAAALHARYGGSRPHVVTNSFPLQPAPPHPIASTPPAFFWFSQTLGPGRGLEPFLASWSQTRTASRLVLLGESRGDYAAKLRDAVPASRRPAITFRPLVSPPELPAVIAAHDIGLALEEPSIPSRDLTITNKILQYLNAGLAIVASGTAGQREVIQREPTAGIVIDPRQTAATTHALDHLLADRAQLALRQRAARTLAESTYCWEREEPRLLALVDSALQRANRVARAFLAF